MDYIIKKKSTKNNKVSKALLEYIKSNSHYTNLLSLELKQTKSNLEKHKETLIFIEEYLSKLNGQSITKEKDIVVLGNESEIPTISSLLKRKEELLNTINREEKSLTLDKELFDVVEFGNVISKNVSVHKRLTILMPIILCLCLSLFFLLFNISKRIKNYITD